MNKNLNLVEILKDCPRDYKLYSPVFGNVRLLEVFTDCENPSFVIATGYQPMAMVRLSPNGKLTRAGECIVFPSKDQRDWSKFAPNSEPKFKVGDRVKHKEGYISGVIEYDDNIVSLANTKEQDDYELVLNKFDINALKPFDKVLVRDTNEYCWHATFYSHHTGTYFYSINGLYAQCVPYEGNKHLLGTKDECDEYFKTWE